LYGFYLFCQHYFEIGLVPNMRKNVTAKQEYDRLELQAHIAEIKRIKKSLAAITQTAAVELEGLEEALEKATQANKPRRVWSDETRRRMLGNKTT
jgi:hypothetical protein